MNMLIAAGLVALFVSIGLLGFGAAEMATRRIRALEADRDGWKETAAYWTKAHDDLYWRWVQSGDHLQPEKHD